VTGLLPLGQGFPHELDGRAGAVEPAVAAAHRLCVAPGAGQGRARLPHDDVALEADGLVRFGTGDDHLALAAVDQDVIADDVLLAVVLMEAAVLGVVDEVVLEENAGGALVGVQPPAAIGIGVDVVEDVARDDRPLGRPERVNAAHVAEEAPAEVVDAIVREEVSLAGGLAVAPAPAGGDAAVEQVGDLVVGDPVVAALAHPDADRAGENVTAVPNDVVVDDVPTRRLRRRLRQARLADAHAAGAEVE
jgi:hypothetical protein